MSESEHIEPVEYRLKWGNWTGIVALAISLVLGTFILYLAYTLADEATNHGFFWQFYSPLLGYFVVAAICQSHFFRTSPKPDISNSIRYFVSIGGAVTLFATNELIFYLAGLYRADWMRSHFLWILLGFYMFGFDDFLFGGHLSRPLKYNSLKAALWYGIIWIIFSIFGLAGVLSDGEKFNYFAGHYQWMVIILLMIAVQFREVIPQLPNLWKGFENPYIRGTVLTLSTIIFGFILGEIAFHLNAWRFPEISDSVNWHHSLYEGTYPLTPIIVLGLYTTWLSGIRGVWRRALARTGMVFFLSFIFYLFFHLTLMKWEWAFNVHEEWYHQIDLYWNFTVSIIPLSWSWFCARYGFVRSAH